MLGTRFHLAFLVTDLEETRHFYGQVLGCRQGREATRWIDFDLYGHQLSAHLFDGEVSDVRRTAVDGDGVPIPHFGLVLPYDRWCVLKTRLLEHGVCFDLPPRVRFEGQPGEQWTMFLRDPSGNFLEFKSFKSDAAVFETD